MKNLQIFHLRDLFDAVQRERIFPDGKTFVDCTPQYPLEWIKEKYIEEKRQAKFDLKNFVWRHFDFPAPPSVNYDNSGQKSITEHIEALWEVLLRQPDKAGGSLLPLPHPYIVPGGRFGEVYYWDSYFTMLGLRESGKIETIQNMIDNFAHLIETVGYIPNGNRSYYIGRSQPPFFALMVQLLADIKGAEILAQYRPFLIKEHQFWTKNGDKLSTKRPKSDRSLRLLRGGILNRYYDENDTPRPESYREDIELSHQSPQNPTTLFRHLRAGAESGWDYSSRWFLNDHDFSSIHTTHIAPVDLNCLLYFLEKTIAKSYENDPTTEGSKNYYEAKAETRAKTILKFCWNNETGFFYDYDAHNQQQKKVLSLAGVFPLFFNLATKAQAKKVAQVIENQFIKAGGVITTLNETGQQWDAPNGWSPLQWMTIMGLENYGFSDLAKNIAQRWLQLNEDVYTRTGKLMEKYNVVDTHLEAGGGEYAGQDGFGWTNGVYLALLKRYKS
jgi:alpha,alpha-trehalase